MTGRMICHDCHVAESTAVDTHIWEWELLLFPCAARLFFFHLDISSSTASLLDSSTDPFTSELVGPLVSGRDIAGAVWAFSNGHASIEELKETLREKFQDADASISQCRNVLKAAACGCGIAIFQRTI